MRNLKDVLKFRVISVFTIAIFAFMALGNCQSIFAEDQKKTECVTGKVYQFEEKGKYDLASANKADSTDAGTVLGGQFTITGNISSITEKEGFPAYAIKGGTLTFSFSYDDSLLEAAVDEEHLSDDNGKKVNGIALGSKINKGVLIIQTSKDGEIWFTVPDEIYTNAFEDNPGGLKEFYTTTDVQMINGCYYRILIAYKTSIRTQAAKVFPPKLEKKTHKKYLEVYRFYAYDETVDIEVPEKENLKYLGSKVRTKKEGYVGEKQMDNDDPHFGWDIGAFYVSGYTDYENGSSDIPTFLKNNGDKLCLWFKLKQDIDKCFGNEAIRVIADHKGSDAEFEVPGGVNETLDFGYGALIVRKTSLDGSKTKQIYTDFLRASASRDADTKVDLFEEGDYEVALDYAVRFDKTRLFGKSILPETAKYRLSFKFQIRNGNSMAFLFDSKTGSELSSGSITENGFRIDLANSQYLTVRVKRETLKDGYAGLEEDTNFNSRAADGDIFTQEGIYTITITNKDVENADPTIKQIYVGTDNILKAYMVNNISISEIRDLIAMGAVIDDDGTIISPETGIEDAGEKNTEVESE